MLQDWLVSPLRSVWTAPLSNITIKGIRIMVMTYILIIREMIYMYEVIFCAILAKNKCISGVTKVQFILVKNSPLK